MAQIKTPDVYYPKTLLDLLAVKAKNPQACLFAGGTYLMSNPLWYPSDNPQDIVIMNQIPELNRVIHSDRYLEVGSLVTLNQLLSARASFLSKPVFKAIEKIASSVVRNQITVGGALCTPNSRYELPCILSVINAQAEIRLCDNFRSARWIPVSKLYNVDGSLTFGNNTILTRVRIPVEDSQTQVFCTVGDPFHNPQYSVIFGMSYTVNQNNILSPSLTVVLPNGGFYNSPDFNTIIGNLRLPISLDFTLKLSKHLVSELANCCPAITDLQQERVKRIFQSVILGCNTSFLEG